jgi:putative PIN family toxin of toxin-antitoxin system
MVKKPRIVLDTNVILSAFLSTLGASFTLLDMLGSKAFSLHLSVPLMLEYEEVLLHKTSISHEDLQQFLAYINSIGIHHQIFYLFRWFLTDHDDDMVLEIAIAAQATHIVTFNKHDLNIATTFGIQVVTPKEFLQELGVIG